MAELHPETEPVFGVKYGAGGRSRTSEIVRDPRHSRGAPTIGDTGIRVLNVAGPYEHSGYSPDVLVGRYPSLTLEAIHSALAFFSANIEEFREAMAEVRPDDETEASA